MNFSCTCMTLCALECSVLCSCALGQANVVLELEVLEEVSLFPEYDNASLVDPTRSAAIWIGDAVGVQVELKNSGALASVPVLLPTPSDAPSIEMEVTRPDGTKLLVPWVSRRLDCSPGEVRPLQSDETIRVNGYLFEHSVRDARMRLNWEYVFEQPGDYTVIARYWVGTPSSRWDWEDQGRDHDTSQFIQSNSVSITVGSDVVPGWQQLKDRDILQFAGGFVWPQYEESENEVADLVAQTQRPWLIEWVDTLPEGPGQE